MKRTARLNCFRCLFAFAIAVVSAPALSQTCAAPIEYTYSPVSGNTCNSTRNLPYLANGAIVNGGPDIVYHGYLLSTTSIYAALEGVDNLSLYVCRGPCGTYSTCLAVIDSVAFAAYPTTIYPAAPGDYYFIVGSASGVCGTYTLYLWTPSPNE